MSAKDRPGTLISFSLSKNIKMSPDSAWERLCDWPSHGDWIPMTRMVIDPTNPDKFVAFSGLGKLALEDRMEVTEKRTEGATRICRVAKTGPVLVGFAEFSVSPTADDNTCIITWREDVRAPYLPKFLAPVAGFIGKTLFGLSIGRIAK
jgi:hypothetical protein